MTGVFVNYRVREEPGYATLVHRELVTRFGTEQVFLASRSIRPGDDYIDTVFETLRRCDVVLAIIGKQWLDLLGDSDDDWVYRELRHALELGLRVIPVLVEDTDLPAEEELPAGVDAVARCQYVRIRHYSIDSDMDHLVRVVRGSLPKRPGAAARPRGATHATEVSRTFAHPAMSVRVVVGDLFTQPAQWAIGFTTTFDTDTTDDLVISRSAVQGQLLHRVYGGDRERLDGELRDALVDHQPVEVETETTKRFGKLARYPLGTVAVVNPGGRRVFCLAYSEMGNDLVARSTVDALWSGVGALWTSVARHGKLAPLAMPVMGSELARIDPLNRENLLKMILLSFVARSRAALFCKELTIVVHPKDFGEITMAHIATYLRRL